MKLGSIKIHRRNMATYLLAITFALSIISCGSSDEEDSGVANDGTITYDADGFVTNAAGTLRLSMVSTGNNDASGSLRLAEPVGEANAKYFSNYYTVAGQPDELTVYVTKMALVRSEPAEGEEAEVPIFINDDGRPLRITGSQVDMSGFFTQIKCYGADGTIFAEECPCGVDTDNNIIEKVPYVDETGAEVLSCPDPETTEVAQSPVSFINVSQLGTFDSLSVSYKQAAAVKGCAETYMQQEGYSGDTPTENVTWERYCTVAGKGTDKSATGETYASSTFLDSTGTAEGELSVFFITEQSQANGSYPIKGGVTLAEDDEDGPQITMVIDTSSMLRFFKHDNYQDKTDPAWSDVSGSYFHVRQFSNQNFVFVGEPGTMSGYSFTALLTSDDAAEPSGSASNPSAYDECAVPNCSRYVKGRISVIYEKDGTPMLFNLATTVGSGFDVSNNSSDGIDPSVLTEDSSLAGTYKFNQTSVDGTNTTQVADIYQFDLDAAVGETFNSYVSEKNTGTNNGWLWGKMSVDREF